MPQIACFSAAEETDGNTLSPSLASNGLPAQRIRQAGEPYIRYMSYKGKKGENIYLRRPDVTQMHVQVLEICF